MVIQNGLTCFVRSARRPPREELQSCRPFERYSGPPMTLGNMRENGVRRLAVDCEGCHHQALLGVDEYSANIPVSAFGPRMVCTRCGAIGADARPNWNERAPACLFGAPIA